jgi:hypothetical protein
MPIRSLYLTVVSALAVLGLFGLAKGDGSVAVTSLPDGARAPLLGAASSDDDEVNDAPTEDMLQGVWARRWGRAMGDDVRFYYFHGDGNGLFRYGKNGLTNTHSYDYRVLEPGKMRLSFRKSGETHDLAFRVKENKDGDRILVFDADPRSDGRSMGYVFEPMPEEQARITAPDDWKRTGRMWIDYAEFKTGGAAFSIYQLNPAGIDGRGTGWHHRGDFNDWSTEALTYSWPPGARMELRFELSGEQDATVAVVREGADGKKTLRIARDPRNWWLYSDFADMGRSFAFDAPAALLPGGLPAPLVD